MPISAKTKEEDEWLRKVKGNVVWPHVSWPVVRALIKMEAIDMAEKQIEKLLKHCGCSEWVAADSKSEMVYPGGEAKQRWSATSMKMGIKDLYQYYGSFS